MNISGLTSGQRLVVLLLVIAIVVVFSMFAGFVLTSVQGPPSPAAPPPASSTPTSPPVTPTPSPTPMPEPEEGIWSQVYYARLLGQIEHQVETLRGLSPRAEVPLNFLDEREMNTLLRRVYLERDPEARLLPYVALGLLPDVPVDIQVHRAAAVGTYVPEQEQLYVVAGQQEISADDRVLLLAHAYAHVLQDQYFDLEGVEARARTTDARLAVHALVEGDAALLTALYRGEDPATADWLHLSELILQAEQPGYGEELDRSAAWGRLQRFPYWEGRRFVVALFEAGGWQAIDRAYGDPPRSTEQVLHLERYLGEERDAPASVLVPDLRAALGKGWTLLVHDTMGELVVGLYLEETLPRETAWRAADGWDGDTFVVWEHEGHEGREGDEKGRRVRVWRSVWDTTAEAAEFEGALVALIPQRYLPARPLDPPRDLPGRWWETSSGAVCLYRVARYVVLVEAPDADTLAEVVGVLP